MVVCCQTGKPRNAIEQAAQVMLNALKTHLPEAADEIFAAEIWAHCRNPSAPHQLHFDTDEKQLGSTGVLGDKLVHPVNFHLLLIHRCYCTTSFYTALRMTASSSKFLPISLRM